MNNRELFYQESGQINPLKQSLSYMICIGVALVLGYLYSIAIMVIPIVYLNFLITLGFGLVLGFISKSLIRFSHNRSKMSQMIQAITIGFLANYFQWTAYISYAYNGIIPSFSLYLSDLQWIIIPENFFTAIGEINRVGVWSMFGITFNGFGLASIWFVEFLIIVAGPIIAVFKTNIYPYSELLSKWYPKYTLFKDFEALSTGKKMMNDLKSDTLKAIESLGKGTGLRHTKIHLYYLKGEEKQYLTFEKIFIEEQGKGKRNRSLLINHFMINSRDAERILERFENKRERIDVI